MLSIRPFNSDDTRSVHKIAADSAFFGAPVEHFLEDRKLFVDSFYRYYTDIDFKNSFVATNENTVVGFVMGCLETRKQQRWFIRNLFSVLFRSMIGKYILGSLTWQYALQMATSLINNEIPFCNLKSYPAHLHINVDENFRGQGLGRMLMITYLDLLSSKFIPGVHLHTTNLNEAACHLYENLGFNLLDARVTNRWKGKTSRPVENRCYGKRLVGVIPG